MSLRAEIKTQFKDMETLKKSVESINNTLYASKKLDKSKNQAIEFVNNSTARLWTGSEVCDHVIKFVNVPNVRFDIGLKKSVETINNEQEIFYKVIADSDFLRGSATNYLGNNMAVLKKEYLAQEFESQAEEMRAKTERIHLSDGRLKIKMYLQA